MKTIPVVANYAQGAFVGYWLRSYGEPFYLSVRVGYAPATVEDAIELKQTQAASCAWSKMKGLNCEN